jgi:structural maintenance of chromosome 3 (chondroitin sulfate proteoglycan 6)
MEEARTQLNALFAKQGRVKRFGTKAERDNYLRQEIAALEAYQNTRSAVLDSTKQDLASTKESLNDVIRRVDGIQGSAEDGRQRVRNLGEQLTGLKDRQSELSERRKELWREDSKLDGLLAHAGDELKSAERSLAAMMDKVSFMPFAPSDHRS